MRLTVGLACAVLWSLAVGAGAADVEAPPEFAPVRRTIEEGVAAQLTPSVAVAVVQNNRLVWAQGFGYADLEQQVPAGSNSIYRLASISKPITATGLMILKDRGAIDLDAPANRYLPNHRLRCYRGEADQITLRTLANHTSGLPLHYNFFYERPPCSVDEAIRCYGFSAAQPGTRWDYSNLGYGTLSYLTEVVSETPWGDFMERHVYDPLGMTHTSHRVRPERRADATVQYTKTVFDGFSPVGNYEFDHPGASAVWSSARDLARFAQMHLSEGELDGVRILSAESAREMQVLTGRRDAEGGSGIGWFVGGVRGRRCVSHSGGMPGVSTMLRLFPEHGAATVVLTNTDNRTMTNRVTEQLAEILFPEVPQDDEPPATEGTAKTGATPPAEESKKSTPLAGTWKGELVHHAGNIPVVLKSFEDGKIEVRFGDGPARRLQNSSNGPVGLRGQLNGSCPTQSEFHGPVTIEFRLNYEDDRLSGVAVALAPGYFALSHWVDLGRE